MTQFTYRFEWDPAKSLSNAKKHRVSFNHAATVFRDPLMRSVYDEDHSQSEERWITLGQAEDGKLLVVIHTHQAIDESSAVIRIISAREATKRERKDYEAGD